MEPKKISFGFMKTKKADKPAPVNNEDTKDYIECVEEQSIKIVGGEKVSNKEPLVIPMMPNSLITPDRLREIAIKVESALEEPEIKTEPKQENDFVEPIAANETLEQMAIRELMQDAKKEIKIENPAIAIPSATKGAVEGEKESTLDDYEAVPVQEFGVAMLRGMGWTPGQASSKFKHPELRPKGLGLGADKVIKAKPEASKDSKQEELVIVKNSYVKIDTGKYSDYYGKVVSLDEDNGRVMVDIPLKKETVSLSEFMMHAVTKTEYDRESKVLNADSYEEYKRKEQPQKSSKYEDKKSFSKQDVKDRVKKEEKENDRRDEKDRRYEKSKDERDRRSEKDSREDRERDRNDRYNETIDRRRRDQDSANGRNKNRQNRDSSSSEERAIRKKKNKKRYSSSDSLSSLSEDDRRRHKHNKSKTRRRSRSRSGSYTRSPSPEAKRDIDKKRKGKKKKRDRDRSPNYRKHRK